MNVNEVIVAALSEFGDPVVEGEYISQPNAPDPERYYSFVTSSMGADYADDEPSHEVALVWVHFHCPRAYDSCDRVAATKRALFVADMSWPEVVNASDADGQHIVFECKYLKGVYD